MTHLSLYTNNPVSKIINPNRSFPKGRPGKRVLLVEGGGMKGAFAGGVLFTLNEFFPATQFDLIIGISSGACSAAYYASTPEPNPERGEMLLDIWRKELTGHKFISIWNPFRGRRLLDQRYLIDFLFKKKYPIWGENFNKKGLPPFYVAVCNLKKKSLEYLQATKDNIYDLLKAATALPIATKGRHKIDKEWFCDAAILNPLPLEDIIRAGYNDITVIMNSPIWWESLPLHRITRFLSFPFNRTINKLMKTWHHHHFNKARNIASNPPPGIKLRVAAPDELLPVGLVTTKEEFLREAVDLGKEKGLKLLSSLKPRSELLTRRERKRKKSNSKKLKVKK